MEKKTGLNSISSKQHNRGLILQLIATGRCTSRIELSKATKLTKMTVSNIISEFIDQKIIEECEEELTGICGRNPIRLQLSENAPKVIGLLIFRDRIQAVLCTMTLQILQIETISFQNLTEESLMQYSFEVVDRLLVAEPHIAGIGISVIGPVDIPNGIILNPPRFYGIQNVHVLEFMKEHYSCPIVLEHDNNSAALAEKLFGAGKDVQDFLFLGISNGIGSGIINHGAIYHTENGLAPEIGHMSINCDGERCSCGNRGCLELYASTYVVLNKLRLASGQELSFEEFCHLSDVDIVDKIMKDMIQKVASALVNVVNLLQIEMILLGHDSIFWDEKYVHLLEKMINEQRFAATPRRTLVRKAHFGENALLVGAAANIVNQIFTGELLL